MEKLLKLASAAADQAEVYAGQQISDSLEFNDAKLEKCDTSMSSGIALRVIKNGRVGLAHTQNLLDAQALVDQALRASANGAEVSYKFPHTVLEKQSSSYSPGVEKLNKTELIGIARGILDYIRQRVDAQVNLGIGYGSYGSELLNSAGTHLSDKRSSYVMHIQMIFPGTGSGLLTFNVGKDYAPIDMEKVDRMIELFRLSANQIVPPTDKMPVIFSPMASFALISRLDAATNPANIYNKISPLCGRIGEKVLSDKFSMWQDPQGAEFSQHYSFDGEGVATRKYHFFENGVYRNYPVNLDYAAKLGVEPTGNGARGSVEGMPAPSALNVRVGTGDKTLDQMIASIDRGLIVDGLMGAHSGNILNGEYSVGVSTGFMIENGVITGRVKDCLLSGNAWDTLNNIIDIENKCQNFGGHMAPAILCDAVSVAGK